MSILWHSYRKYGAKEYRNVHTLGIEVKFLNLHYVPFSVTKLLTMLEYVHPSAVERNVSKRRRFIERLSFFSFPCVSQQENKKEKNDVKFGSRCLAHKRFFLLKTGMLLDRRNIFSAIAAPPLRWSIPSLTFHFFVNERRRSVSLFRPQCRFKWIGKALLSTSCVLLYCLCVYCTFAESRGLEQDILYHFHRMARRF